MGPLARAGAGLTADLLGPLRVPRRPLAFARFGLNAAWPATALLRSRFGDERARALLAGCAAHSMLRLEQPFSASFGLVLGLLGHSVGWPMARGGSQAIADAMDSYLRALGGEIRTGVEVASLDELPPARAVLLDLGPRQVLRLAGRRLPRLYREGLRRFRYGPGVFKLDWALDGPIPWAAGSCARAGTLHLGGTLDEIAAAERRRRGGPRTRAAVRAARPAEPVRRDARPGRTPHGLGVLPRPQRLGRPT